MTTTRRGHTANLLLDGKILVVGGDSGTGGYVGTCELFDPVAGTWLPTGSLSNITGYGTNGPTNMRGFHTATLLSNGKVLVAGGYGVAILASAQLYDPATGTWRETGFMNTARYQQTATLLANGKVLVAGGIDDSGNSTDSAELYDPATEVWTEVGPMQSTRWQHSATLLTNGMVLLAGGQEVLGAPFGSALTSTELYDPINGTWTTSGSMHVGRREHLAIALPSGAVLIAGGFDAGSISSSELYNPASGTWANSSAMTVPRDLPQGTLLPNGKVLATGGYDNNSSSGSPYLSSAEIFDPKLGSWTASGTMHDRRDFHTSTSLEDGRVLIAGGYNGGSVVASTELFDSGTTTATNGFLKVTISPGGAISAGAQWQVDGGALQNSGSVVAHLSGGTHVVSFTAISGYVKPADQLTSILAPNSTNSVTGVYTLAPGGVQVAINPAGAVSAGAQWQVDGGAFQANNAVVANLSVGTHTVAFKAVSGWFAPGNKTVTVPSAATTNVSATYTLDSGSLQVTLNPAGAVSAGAQWQVDGGSFRNSGDVVTGLSTGDHLLTFKTTSGWIVPGAQTVVITANTTTSATGNYAFGTGAFTVTLAPAGAVSAGARWQMDGGALQTSGAILTGLGVSNHTLSFRSLAGWITPGDQTVTVGANVTNGATGLYVLGEKVKPTLSFVAPINNQHLNTSTFTATGKAKDNVKVAGVFYQLNGGAWVLASSGNNFTDWSAANLVLTPGPNTFKAYAVDTSNNLSATNTVNVVYVLSDRLTVVLQGKGTVSPNYNNAVLQIGNNYSMTATAAKGFKFSDWSGSASASTAKLTFNMQSNLSFTATFVDVARPVNVALTPKAKQRLTGPIFTATGAAKDNVGVTNVYYQLNHNGWTNAQSLNNWTNWTLPNLVLSPGSNTLQTYAIDVAGNRSLTNTVQFTYVLTDRLVIQFNGGRGTLSPNYSNAVLEIGKNYSMTAKPATGFKFLNWTGSLSSSAAKLVFNMQSNLTFTANLLDVARPVNVITVPKANQKWNSAVFVASGRASDNVAVSNVWYQLNGTGWNLATLAPNHTDWTTPNLELISGANQIQAFAVDAVGNASLTNNVNLTYTVLPVTAWAPDSLNGLLAHVATLDSNATENVSFDSATFAQTGVDTNADNYGVGNFLYNKTGTNVAELTLTFTAPANVTNNETQVMLVFTNHYDGYFTNDNGAVGGISFVVATNFLPVSLVGKTLLATNTTGTIGNAIKFNNLVSFTQTGSGGLRTGSYTFVRFSPVSGMVSLALPGQVSYSQLTFTNAANGTYFLNSFDTSGNLLGGSNGKFKLK